MYTTEFCEVRYLNDINAVFCKWKKFCKADDYRNPLLHGLKLINENQSKIWITDTSTGFDNEEAENKWLIEVFMNEMIKSSCEEIIFIIDDNSPIREHIEDQGKALSQHFKVRLVNSLEGIDS